MKGNILFYFRRCQVDKDNKPYPPYPGVGAPYRIGDIIAPTNACYFKGKELGYEDGNIYLEWPDLKYNVKDKVKYSFTKPLDTILPIKYLYPNEFNTIPFTKVIDLNSPNSLYDGCPPFSIYYREKHSEIFPTFLIKFYLKTGIAPYIKRKKQKGKRFTILFHHRDSYYSTQRNSKIDDYNRIVDKLKSTYEDVKCVVIGDCYKSPIEIFNKFEEVHNPYIKQFDKFIDIVADADIIIGTQSSPLDMARIFYIPYINLYQIHGEPLFSVGYDTRQYWNELRSKWGEESMFWDDPRIFFRQYADEKLDLNKIMEFINVHYQRIYKQN